MISRLGLCLAGVALCVAPAAPSSTIGSRASSRAAETATAWPVVPGRWPDAAAPGFGPGDRVLLDAHNAYPDRGRFAERLETALATGVPIAIEQDLAWCASGAEMAPVVSHEKTCVGGEPTLDTYFFARVRPLVEAALASGRSGDWPLLTLNLDFKTNEPAHHAAVWALLGRYERWLTTAPRLADEGVVADLDVGPLLVLTGSPAIQAETFHGAVPVGRRLRVFGAIEGLPPEAGVADGLPRATAATNYRRWWNHPWKVVEPEGQRAAGPWTPDDDARLRAIVADGHARGLWVRFYTLNGVEGDRDGWTPAYNFGSLAAAQVRWRAAIAAGVDFVATDQYGAFAAARGAADGTAGPRPRGVLQ